MARIWLYSIYPIQPYPMDIHHHKIDYLIFWNIPIIMIIFFKKRFTFIGWKGLKTISKRTKRCCTCINLPPEKYIYYLPHISSNIFVRMQTNNNARDMWRRRTDVSRSLFCSCSRSNACLLLLLLCVWLWPLYVYIWGSNGGATSVSCHAAVKHTKRSSYYIVIIKKTISIGVHNRKKLTIS